MFLKTHNDRSKDTCVYPESSPLINLKVIIFSLRGKVPVAHRSRMPIKSEKHSRSHRFRPSDIWRGHKLARCNRFILTRISAAERRVGTGNVARRRSGAASLWRAHTASDTLTFFPGTLWSVLARTPRQWTGNKLYEPLRIYNRSSTKYAGVPGESPRRSPGTRFGIWQRNGAPYFFGRDQSLTFVQ